MAKKKPSPKPVLPAKGRASPIKDRGYVGLLSGWSTLLDDARRGAARAVNAILTATYWEVGRRIVDFEQGGKDRAGYGEALLNRLASDLTATHGRGDWAAQAAVTNYFGLTAAQLNDDRLRPWSASSIVAWPHKALQGTVGGDADVPREPQTDRGVANRSDVGVDDTGIHGTTGPEESEGQTHVRLVSGKPSQSGPDGSATDRNIRNALHRHHSR